MRQFIVTATIANSVGLFHTTYSQLYEGSNTNEGYSLAVDGFMNHELPRWTHDAQVLKMEVVVCQLPEGAIVFTH